MNSKSRFASGSAYTPAPRWWARWAGAWRSISRAVGDTVNTASRLQDLTKEYGCRLVISAQVAERAGADVSAFPAHQIEVRNRAAPLTIRAIENPRDVALGRGNDSHRRFHLLT